MDLAAQKEDFSCAYVRAVAAAGGFSVDSPIRDNESIDLVIRGRDYDGKVRFPKAELQVKCTANTQVSENSIRYPLKLKNYDDLRPTNVAVPRFLVVVLVPESCDDWLFQSTDEMIVRHCGYIVSLRGLPDSPNTTSVTVDIPTDSVFNVPAISGLMERISDGLMK